MLPGDTFLDVSRLHLARAFVVVVMALPSYGGSLSGGFGSKEVVRALFTSIRYNLEAPSHRAHTLWIRFTKVMHHVLAGQQGAEINVECRA